MPFQPAKLSTITALLFGCSLFAISIICLVFARYFFLSDLDDIERQHVLQHSLQAKTVIESLLQDQQIRSFDWAYWDESYRLVTAGDQTYHDRNLYYDGLVALDIDLVAFLNRQGRLIESRMTTSQSETIAIPAKLREQLLSPQGIGHLVEAAIRGEADIAQAHSGLIRFDDDILVVTLTPIRNSQADSPVGGWLIWGRYLSAVFPSQYTEILSSENTLVSVTPQDHIDSHQFPIIHPEENDSVLVACVILDDIHGNPIATLKSSRPREIYTRGEALIGKLTLTIFIASVLISLLTLLALRQKVGRRFQALERGLKALIQDQYSTPIKVGGNDEFSMVGEVINQILAKSSHTHAALHDVMQKFNALHRTSNLGLLMVLDGRVVEANAAMASILRYPAGQELVGCSLMSLYPHPIEPLTGAISAGQTVFDTELQAADGSLIACKLEVLPIHQQSSKALMLSVKDVSQQKAQEAQIRQLEKYDAATGLMNRHTFLQSLDHLLSKSTHDADSTLIAVLYIRIERFHNVTGAFGHQTADDVVRAVTNRLRHQIDISMLGRVAENEFAFILTTASRFTAYRYAKSMASALRLSLEVNKVEVRLSASIGLVLASELTPTAAQMLNAAEFSAYGAESAPSHIQLFTRKVAAQMKNHTVIQRDMAQAIRDGSIYPQFQPLICGHTETICGFEALARWQHPEIGHISPVRFIPVAESRELIVALGNSILEKSCAFLAEVNGQRQALGLKPLSVHVNLSGPHFSHPQLLPFLRTMLDRYPFHPEHLTLELTESMLIDSVPQVQQQMSAIKGMGIKLALDDFGTGYSALSSLCEFPLDVVKLDRSFIRRVDCDTQSNILVSSITGMAKSLGLKIVAEGIETEPQKRTLQALAIEEFQGFYFYQPMMAEDCLALALQTPATAD
ncbi:bifunctional diguanylate cyclase/phosphodiesterase [Photobacterium atrarenae]|uniref:EAL domain-containing protein n=1 Tax=Photobacterium atrarenae TaxID=865757 RepID=A0ABY5GPY4_9GAMM|nr:EAL domain-containing protein [Photobacterium atrarenae]UTV30978.1 EAL domain-containing protein [Photobacterium atrarenae]